MTPVLAAVAILTLSDAASFQINIPIFDPAPGDRCRVTMVKVEPDGRYLVAQGPHSPPPPGRAWSRLRWRATTLAGLPAVLATLPPPAGGPCGNAIVLAAGNAPMSAVMPAYAALRAAGITDFATEDAGDMRDDPRWDGR